MLRSRIAGRHAIGVHTAGNYPVRSPVSTVSASRQPVSASRQHRPSLGPAVIVLVIAVVIMLSGAVVAILGSNSAHAPAAQLGTKVPGVPFRAIPAQADLEHITSGGEPPADVVKALTVPSISRYVGDSNQAGNLDQYEESVTISVPATTTLVDDFYRRELSGAQWSMQFDGSAGGHLELIGQRNGSDGYQWRVAIVVTSVNPTLSPALAGSNQTSTSSVVMTLYQVGDAS
jgi:hypothetical protein